MRTPSVSKSPNRSQVVRLKSIPAPIGGWNAIDALANMKETEAVVLDNFFPKTGYCELRGGSDEFATDMTGTGKTLMVYNGLSGLNKMFCATESGVYDVSSAGPVGAAVASRTNGKHVCKMFGDGTNQWLIAVNGVDKPLYFDGSTWTEVDGVTTPALTGITTTSLVSIGMLKGRLFFIANDQMAFWYLSAGAAGGALTKFDLSGVAQKGGYLMAMESWTLDSGQGPDDRMVFVTSKGEVMVYQGDNPSSNWSMVGLYETGSPLGRKCIAKSGSDLVILTENGAFSINTIIQTTSSNYSYAVSRKIEEAFNGAARSYGSNFGWEAVIYPAQSAVLVNVPLAEDGTHHQYVMNTITQKWCRFIGWDAESFAVFNNELYYCQGTSVIKAWTGAADQGANIEAYGKHAFSYFGSGTQLKDFKLFRPILKSNGSIEYLIDIDVDYDDNDIIGNISSSSTTFGSVWDTAKWDIAKWGGSSGINKNWQSVNEWPGFCASGKIKVATNSLSVQWISSDYVYEMCGII